jgi:protein-tyrosine-phosphatase
MQIWRGLMDFDIDTFDYVVTLDNSVRRDLITNYSISAFKVKSMQIADPFGNDMTRYNKCALEHLWRKSRNSIGLALCNAGTR